MPDARGEMLDSLKSAEPGAPVAAAVGSPTRVFNENSPFLRGLYFAMLEKSVRRLVGVVGPSQRFRSASESRRERPETPRVGVLQPPGWSFTIVCGTLVARALPNARWDMNSP